jgi:ATP-dependent exoDNAse (exonuclease V) alpha subunit
MEAMGTYVAVTAASGIAAAPLKGVTLDSYMCSNEDHTVEENIRKAKMNRPELATLQVLIVDEVSMVSAEKMNRVMDIFRAVRRPETPYPQFLLVGDFKQLPPVKGRLLLGSETWSRLDLEVILLTDGFRQTNQPAFLEMLDEAGMGALSDASKDLLESRVGVKFDDTQDIRPTILVPHNQTADVVNARELAQLVTDTNPKHAFVARLRHLMAGATPTDPWVAVEDCSSEPPQGWRLPDELVGADVFIQSTPDTWAEARSMMQSCMKTGVFEAAVGAQVVFTANVCPPRIVNGTRGVITAFTPYPVVALLDGDTVVADPFVINRRVKRTDPSVVFKIEYVPLKLAWALTIHSSQGMSIDFAEIDLGPNVFSDGQGYVALSRLRTLQGLSLRQFHPRSIRANQDVVKWYLSHAETPAPTSSVLEDDVEDPAWKRRRTGPDGPGETESDPEDFEEAG